MKLIYFVFLFGFCKPQYFLSGSDDNKLRIWNKNSIIHTEDYDFKITTLDYDSYNNVILIGSSDTKITLFYLGNKTTRHVCDCSTIIKSVDKETFVISSSNKLDFYNIYNFSVTNHGNGLVDINDMKLLKNENKLILAQKKNVIVFDLASKNFKISDMKRDIYSIDSLDRDFIVNHNKQGSEEICIHKIENNDSLTKIKCTGFSSVIITIKIINKDMILFGSGESKLHKWGENDTSITSHSTPGNKKVLSIEEYNSQEFICGLDDGKIYKVDMNNFSFVSLHTGNFNKVYGLKLISSAFFDSLSSTESTTALTTSESTTLKLTFFDSLSSTLTDTTETTSILAISEIFTTLPTTATKEFFNLHSQNIQLIMNYFELDIDMNNCLSNCSNNGKCKLTSDSKFVCECFAFFVGERCQHNTRPCSRNLCRNNSTCVEDIQNKNFSCKCYSENNEKSLYYGTYCENKIDLCSNETCSNHGYCYEENDKPKCSCFYMYFGQKCQHESDELKKNKKIVKTTTIIAIIILVLFFLMIILCDLIDCLIKREKKAKKNLKTNVKPKSNSIKQQFLYLN